MSYQYSAFQYVTNNLPIFKGDAPAGAVCIYEGLYGGVTEGTKLVVDDFLFVSAMFAYWTQPELVVHQRTTSDDACGEFRITTGTNLTVIRDQRLASGALALVRLVILWRVS